MTQHAATGLRETIEDERLRPFLPLVYTAWSDGELSNNEIEGICNAIAKFVGIDEDCQIALRHWLDPAHPPTPGELETLREQIAAWARDLDLSQTPTVGDLGIAIAERTRATAPISRDERGALSNVEDQLGTLYAAPSILGGSVRLATIAPVSPTFDVAGLTTVLDGQHHAIRNKMRSLLARPEFAYPDEMTTSAYREHVLGWVQMLADEGVGSLAYPAPYGADDTGAFVAAFAMLGHHDLSLMTKFGVQFGLFGGSIARLGTSRHHEEYLVDVGSLALPGCFAMTETAHGSNVRDLETIAEYDAATDELVVTTPNDLARKDYIGNAATHGRLAVVFARLMVDGTDHGAHAVLVPIRAEDGSNLTQVRIEDNAGKGGLNGVDNGRIWFDGVRVPRTALLNRYASIDDDGIYTSDIPNPDRRFFATIGTLVGGRIGVGAASVSVTKSALTIALRYAYRRRQFGTEPGRETLLIDYPLHQQRLIPRLAATYAYHFAFERLTADLVDEAADPRRIEARAAGLKARATRHAIDTVQEAREACGGQGFLSVNRLTEMRKDADIFTTYEGDNTVLLQLVAKGLLSDFRQQFNSLNMIGLIRQLTRHALGTVSEAAPITRSTTSDSRLLEASWQLEQLQERERHQVGSLARRLKHRIDANVDPFDAFTQVQTHAFAAAHSHVDHHVLDSFVSRINELDAGPVRDVLDRLRSLHGLATIRSDIGWFQQHGILSASTAEAIDKLQERLVADLAGQSLGLVDAFAIPDEVLAAPIAAYDRHAEVPG